MDYFYYFVEHSQGIILEKFKSENDFKRFLPYLDFKKISFYRSTLDQQLNDKLNCGHCRSFEVDSWRDGRWL